MGEEYSVKQKQDLKKRDLKKKNEDKNALCIEK